MLRTACGSGLLKGVQHLPAPSIASSSIRSRRSLLVSNAAMDSDKGSPTVSAEWLLQRLGQPDIKVLDASWYMPVQARNGLAEFKAKRIPGARFFDIDGISDPKTDLPHMLPSNAAFSHAMDALGITPTDTVVVYDGMGCFSAPRAWWTLKAFGHEKVYVLDGGLPAWEGVSGPVAAAPVDETQIMEPTQRARAAQDPGTSPAKLDTNQVRSLSQMLANVGAPGDAREQMVDARSHGRFIGVEPEPRAGLRGGHIPGAKNVPFPSVLESGRLKPADDLKAVFQAAGIDLNQPLVGSCGSGLTACVLALAVHKATGGSKLIPVYDGSWCEWGSRDDVPISTTEP